MATPTAELLITPEVSKTAIRSMQKDFDKGFDKVGKDADKAIEKGVFDGIKGGLKKGRGAIAGLGRGIGGAAKKGFDNLGGARGIATGVLGLGVVGLIDSIDRASQGADLTRNILSDTNAARQIATAENAGFDLDQFAAFSRTLQQGGFTEQQDINDVIFDIQEKVADAQTGGNPLLKQFSELEGQDLTNSVLASIGQLEGNKQSFALAELGFGGETGQNLLRVIQDASTGEDGSKLSGAETLENLNTANMSQGELIADTLTKTAALATDFQKQALERADAHNAELIAAMTENGDVIKAVFEGDDVTEKKQVDLISGLVENQKTAVEARKTLDASMLALNTTVLNVIDVIKSIGVATGAIELTKAEQAAQDKNSFTSRARDAIGGTLYEIFN